MDRINFCGKTNIILDETFYSEYMKRMRKLNMHLNLPEGSRNLLPGRAYSTNISNDSFVVMVRNQSNGFVKKVPVIGSIKNLIDDIALKTAELADKSKVKLTALIIGGKPLNSDNGNTTKTLNMLADLLCENEKIDTTILAGLKKNKIDTLKTIGIRCTKKDTKLIFPSKQDPNFLENNFDYIELTDVEIP